MNKTDSLIDTLFQNFFLVVIAMVLIYAVYAIAKSLIGGVPAEIGGVIVGLALAYIAFTNKEVRKRLMRKS